MTTTTASCPRCSKGFIHADKDMHGAYISCLICGWMEDQDNSATPDDDLQHLPYIGLNKRWDNLVAGYREVWRQTHKKPRIAERIILTSGSDNVRVICPMVYRNHPCEDAMRHTGQWIKTPTKNGLTGGHAQALREYRCHRSHHIGVTQGFTAWA